MKDRVLITGANGLIGEKVVELLRTHCDPVVIVRKPETKFVGVETIVADLASPEFLTRLPSRMDAVIHLAQSPGFANYPESAHAVFQVNTDAFAKLLQWAAKVEVRHLVHASTGGLYGRGPRPFGEADPIALQGPLAFYFATKAAAELLATAYHGAFNVAALRFFFVYGPGQRDAMLIPRLVQSVAAGDPIKLAGVDGMRLNPVYIDDAAAAVIAALRLQNSAIVNVAGAEVLSIRAVAECIGEIVGRSPTFKPSSELDGQDLIADITRMRTLLHSPTVVFRDGIVRLAKSMRLEAFE